MGSDSANLAASVAKSLEVERSPGATQRANQVAQEQLAGESAIARGVIKADAAASLRQTRIRQERERRRRELERRVSQEGTNPNEHHGDDAGLDVVV